MPTSACGMRHNGHIRVTDKTLVTSFTVRTIVLHDGNAKSCVIMQLLPVFMAKHASEQKIVSNFTPKGMVL